MAKTNNKTKEPKDPLASVLDENIPLDKKQRERMGWILVKDINNAITDNKANIEKVLECDRMYEGIAPKKSFPWKGASSLWIPLAEWTVDAVFARIMMALFGKTPYVRAEGRTKESAANAETVTELLDYVFSPEVMHLEKVFKPVVKEACKKPRSTCKLSWQIIAEMYRKIEMGFKFAFGDKEKNLPEEEAQQLIDQGIMPVNQEPIKLTTKEPYELYNGPKLDYLPYVYYVAPVNSTIGTKPRFEAQIIPMRWNDIVKMDKKGKFYDGVLKTLKEVGELKVETSSTEEDIRNKELKGRDYLFSVAEYHGYYGFDDEAEAEETDQETRSEKEETEVICLVEMKSKTVMSAKYPLTKPKTDRRVFYNTRYETLGNRFEGRGVIQKVEQLNRAVNDYYNHLINNAMMAMTKMFKRKRGADDLNVDDPDIYPGCVIDVKEMTDFEVIDMGDLKSVSLEIVGLVMKFAERLTQVTPWGLGTQPGKSEKRGAVTATEFSGIMAEANVSFNITAQNFVETLVNICEDIVELYSYNMPDELKRKVRGSQGGFSFSEEEQPDMAWEKRKFRGEFNFYWNVTDDRSRSVERDIYFLNNFISLPFMQTRLKKVWEMAKSVAISLGKKDWESILPSEQEINVEQGKIDQQLEAQRLMAIKQMLANKGYTPDEIQKAMQKLGLGATNVPVAGPEQTGR